MRALLLSMLAALLLLGRPALAEKRLFAEDSVLYITLAAPVGDLMARRDDLEGRITGKLLLDGAVPETVPVTIGLRGNRRRDRKTCVFAPLRLEFPKSLPEASLFHGQGRLKLVTHCRAGEQFQQFILLEYAAYRLLNVLTDESFRVRLAMIAYREAEGRSEMRRFGFLIEDVDDMARRAGKREHETTEPILPASLDAAAAARLALFQEMIGNLDWSITAGPPGEDCCHNSKPIAGKGATDNLIPVPYDFDYSGLVDAPYAVPPAGVPVAGVRQRRYMGLCAHNSAVPAAAVALKSRRDALLAALDAVPSLAGTNRDRAASYLADYLDRMLEPDALAARVAKQCRGSHIRSDGAVGVG